MDENWTNFSRTKKIVKDDRILDGIEFSMYFEIFRNIVDCKITNGTEVDEIDFDKASFIFISTIRKKETIFCIIDNLSSH